jgi:hypothetical protein
MFGAVAAFDRLYWHAHSAGCFVCAHPVKSAECFSFREAFFLERRNISSGGLVGGGQGMAEHGSDGIRHFLHSDRHGM